MTSRVIKSETDFVIAGSTGTFMNPGPGSSSLLWQQGTTQNITWWTDRSDVYLSLWSTRYDSDMEGSGVYNLTGRSHFLHLLPLSQVLRYLYLHRYRQFDPDD